MKNRRIKAQVEQLERQIYEVLEEDHPQSIRHVFYRMTNPRLPEPVDKTEQGYQQVQNRLKLMRRAGKIPYGWISDATRRGYHTNTFQNAAQFVQSMRGLYRQDIWSDADTYVEVWVESRSLAGVLVNECKELAVSLYPAGGFASMTLVYEAATEMNHLVSDDGHPCKKIQIYYIGDYDPAGVLIDVSIEKELRTHLHESIDFTFTRLAVNPEQIKTYDLPTKPRKKSERRMPNLRETVEAEAMPASMMRTLVREHVEIHLPEKALEVAKVAEESEREWLINMSAFRSQYGDQPPSAAWDE